MNALREILQSSPLVERLGWTLIHSLWQGALAAALLKISLLVIRTRAAQARYLAACGILLVLAALPVLTFVSIRIDATTNLIARTGGPGTSAQATPIVLQKDEAPAATRITNEPRLSNQSHSQPQASVAATPPVPTPAVIEHRAIERLSVALPWIVLAWLAGVVAMSLWNFGGWMAVQQLKFLNTKPVPPVSVELLKKLASRLRLDRPVRLMQSTLATTPLVIGVFRPMILVPAAVLTDLPVAELESILAHELAHILRHDYLVNLLQSVIETLLFYHPAVWWISRQIRIERENCCDDLAISVTRDRATYVRALAAVASVRVPALAPAAAGGKLLPRLRRILGAPDGDARRSPRWLAGAIVVMCLIVALAPRFQPVAKAAAAEDSVRVRGRVIDSSGKPVAAATVYAVSDIDEPLAQTLANEKGEFEIEFRKSKFTGEEAYFWKYVAIAASAPGYAPGWERWDQTDGSGKLVLQLKRGDVPIEGRILDLEGQPAKGALVRLYYVKDEAKSLDSLTIGGSDLSYLSRPNRPLLPGSVVTGAAWLRTDGQGRFRITGIGADRTAVLQVRGPGLAISEIEVATRPQETESRSFQSYIEVRRTVYGAKFDFAIEPGRVIEGTVRDADTHKPIAGVTVAPSQWTRLAKSVTDANGHYRIEGLRRKGVFKITAMPNDQQCYFMQDALLHDAESAAPTTIDFDLHRGVWITGKVINAVTGEPVEGTRINFVPYLSNAFVQKLPEFRHPVDDVRIPGDWTRYVSRADGTYRVVAAPGPAIVSAWCVTDSFCRGTGADAVKGPFRSNGGHFDTYRPWPSKNFPTAMKEVNLPENVQGDTHLDFQLDPGITIHLKVVDPQGKPLIGVRAFGDHPGFPLESKQSATFDAVAFGPDEKRTLWFWYMPRHLARTLTLKPSDAPGGQFTVELEPLATVTGRLIGPDGLPMANAMMQTDMDSPGAGTDADGRFKLMVVPGRPSYHVQGIKGRTDFDTDADKVAIKAGETKEIGDIHYKEYR